MIEFSRDTYDDVIRHANEGAPEEVCGVLGGERGPDRSVVESVHRADNVDETPRTRYHLDPERQLAIIEGIEAGGADVVGFYHSHPAGGSTPSGTDVTRATWSGYSYAICALNGYPYLGSWRWDGDAETFEQEIVRVV